MAALFWFGLGWWASDGRNREMASVVYLVCKGGCLDEFKTARNMCQHLGAAADGAEAEACVKATAALRKCFAGKPEWFGDEFIGRLDVALDQDTKPTPEEIKAEEYGVPGTFRWWTGMRRS
ncbi:unnamed protein product [Alopecurus aequalis]